jgi:hypothetical protein
MATPAGAAAAKLPLGLRTWQEATCPYSAARAVPSESACEEAAAPAPQAMQRQAVATRRAREEGGKVRQSSPEADAPGRLRRWRPLLSSQPCGSAAPRARDPRLAEEGPQGRWRSVLGGDRASPTPPHTEMGFVTSRLRATLMQAMGQGGGTRARTSPSSWNRSIPRGGDRCSADCLRQRRTWCSGRRHGSCLGTSPGLLTGAEGTAGSRSWPPLPLDLAAGPAVVLRSLPESGWVCNTRTSGPTF